MTHASAAHLQRAHDTAQEEVKHYLARTATGEPSGSGAEALARAIGARDAVVRALTTVGTLAKSDDPRELSAAIALLVHAGLEEPTAGPFGIGRAQMNRDLARVAIAAMVAVQVAEKLIAPPLRMAEANVEAIDGAWKRLGFKSRMAFIREAMGLALEARGEGEAAKAARNG